MPGYQCPVCDYPNLSEPPRSEFGGGSYEICPSCGFQFGINDDDEGISYEQWRRRWEAKGMPWTSVALKRPTTWNPVAKHVAPGGAALRRPSDSAQDQAAEDSTEAKEPKTAPKKAAAPSAKPGDDSTKEKPAKKPAAKKEAKKAEKKK